MGLKGILATAVVAGGVFTGALFTWDGGQTLEDAGKKISEQAQYLNIFKQNEGDLINRINDLRADIDQLQATINQLLASEGDNNETIVALRSELNEKIAEISRLENELIELQESADADGEALANEILRLQEELNIANAEALELQSIINNTTTVTPDQNAVDAALEGYTPPGNDKDPEPAPLPHDVEVLMLSGVPMYLNGDFVGVQFDNKNGQIELANNNGARMTINGVTIQNGNVAIIGSADELAGKVLTLTSQWGNSINILFSIK